ncbi:unnamed protein product [Ostreobium quekettii]|uniref:Rhodanese domain-containing protein n=1 Tax=Ostreobium quekettii TaxID=121088 RepID=A0A8S1J857_9CHLO|nr:unnamed protein product [Ostreobium quekettii]|eukprot:evm.model.scf_414EXC.8 EVM.evm.TU.scf_414EXC.8   scf_414EXC:71400-73004(+)
MQAFGTVTRGGGCASSARRAGAVSFNRGRGWAVCRREIAVAATDCPPPRNLKTKGDPARAAALGSGAIITTAAGLVPAAMAAEGLDLTAQSLTGFDVGALIAEHPNGAALAALGGIFAVKLGAMAVQGLAGKVRTMQPYKIAQVVKSTRRVVVVDVRSKAEKEGGGPDWGQYGKRAVALPYKRTGDGAFGKRFARLRGVGRDALVVLVDSDGSQAASAARDILKAKDIGSICCIQGGAKGWRAAQMPWRTPAGLKLPAVSVDGIVDSYRAHPGPYKLALGAYLFALSAGLLISEADVVLEVVGLLGAGQLLLRRMVFAEDRSATIRQLREIRDEKIGVGSAGEDLRRLASAVFDGKKEESVVTALTPAVNGVADTNGTDDVGSAEPVVGTGADAAPVAMGGAQ